MSDTSLGTSKKCGLTIQMIEQLESYCEFAKQSEFYYGQKKYFESRHEKILKWLGMCRDLRKMA